jgi:hypothetical protein
MKFCKVVSTVITLGLLCSGPVLLAQEETTEPPAAPPADTPGVEVPPQENPLITEEEKVLTYDDYTIKAYTITAFGGNFSGAKYLENMDLGPRTVLTPGAGDILGYLTGDPSKYDGEVLLVSRDADRYTGAHKEIKSGPAFGMRIGVYISEDFHLDITGTYATGTAVTTMRFTEDPENFPEKSERIEVDRDDGYSLIKGGLSMMYDATPAKFFGIVPRLGFGLGGLINSYSQLPDVTGLYLEGNLALNYELFKNFQIGGQVDLTNFAYDVPELGYSNMVNYVTFSAGLTVFLDTIPAEVRAAHLAAKEN